MGLHEPHCTTCGPEARGIFCVLAGDHLQRLDQEKTVQRYERGQAIFRTGDPPRAVFCVYAGRVKLYKIGKKAEEQVIRLLGPGEFVGHRALLADEPYAATALAIEPTTICTISRETLLGLVRESPELGFKLMAKLAHELRRFEELMVSRTEDSVRVRTAQMLLWLSDEPDTRSAASVLINAPLRRGEMAQMIGTSPETLSRTLHNLAERGILRLTRSEIEINDMAALRKIVRRRS